MKRAIWNLCNEFGHGGRKASARGSGLAVAPSSWSPDRKKIALFANRSADAEILNQYRIPFHFLLYSINAASGAETRLFDFPVSGFEWSPDGQQILYISSYEDPQHSDLDVVQGKKIPMSAIYIFSVQSGTHRRLTSFGRNCMGSWCA